MGAARDQAGDVGDVGDQDRADLVGDLGEAGEIDRPGHGGAAAEDHLGTLGAGQVADLVQVDPAGVAPDAVLHPRNQVPVAETPQPCVR